MTQQNTMPDVVWVGLDLGDWSYEKTLTYNTKVVLADHMNDLLLKIWGQIEFCKKHNNFQALDKAISLIDKVLEKSNGF